MKYYHYLYYKIYCGLRNLGNWELADKAMMALCTLEGINILKLLHLTKLVPLKSGYRYDDKIVLGAICVLLIAINSYLFLRKKKYLEIEKRFKKESKRQKLIGDIVVSLYALATVISMFILV